MSGSFFRGQLVLQMIPREPRGITVTEIFERLRDRYEIDTSRRTVQRDLADIACFHPLQMTDDPSPRYYWPECANVELVPGHDDYSALTWNLLESYLAPLLPESMAREAQPVFDTARRYLEDAGRTQVLDWRQRVRMIPRAFGLHPPTIDASVQEAVYSALWHKDQVRVRYLSRSNNEIRTFDLHPHGLVVREGIFYLVARVDGYDDIRHFALHRIESADDPGRRAELDPDFDLDAYIRDGGFSYVAGEEIDLVLRFESAIGHHLLEARLNAEQISSTLADGRLEIRARLLDTLQLRWWLLGFGSGVEVVAPAPLRTWMRDEAMNMLQRYESASS